jgi:uncharacterized protein (TIGR02001 family)
MKFSHSIYALALASSAIAAPAIAQDAASPATQEAPDTAPEAPASDFTISGGATLVSDYRFRGISQTNKRPAVQGTFGITHASGFYASIWGSSIDDYVASGADQEIDLIAGYKTTVGGTTFDVGATYYVYPDGCCGVDTDFIEPYVAVTHSFGGVSAKVLAAYAPKQSALSIGSGDEDNFYLAGDLSGTIPTTGIAVTGHLGHSFGPSYLTIGKGYTDWSIGASYAVKNLSFGLAYVDTNKSLFAPSGRNIAKAGVVASVGVAF